MQDPWPRRPPPDGSGRPGGVTSLPAELA